MGLLSFLRDGSRRSCGVVGRRSFRQQRAFTCKAVVLPRFGGPDVLQIRSNEKLPELGSKEVLLATKAASVNPLDVRQAIKLKTARGLHSEDSHYYKSLMRLDGRSQMTDNMQNTQLRAMSTCQDTRDSVEVDDVHKVQCYEGYRRLSRGILQEGHRSKGRSRGTLKWRTQQLDDEAVSSTEESAQSLGNHDDQKRAAPYNMDDSSESQSDDMDYDDKLEAMKADSDMDSDSDDASTITPNDIFKGVKQDSFSKLSEKEQEKARRKMMDQLISAALDGSDEDDDEDGPVPEDEQRSLRVGIIGAVNAGKSTLTNLMVGTKVAAVSRKRNTTLSEILGIVTNGRYQILLYDTPGLVLDILGKPSKTDTRRRSESAWQLFSHCEALLVLVDAYRQIYKPDKRVQRLIETLGAEEHSHLKKSLVLNKVDIIENKKLLLPLAQEFGKLPGYENIFMVSALTGSGVRDIASYLMDQAVMRPWEEEPGPLNEETIRTLSMEVVREHLLDRVHEEIPYELDHQLVDWQELEDGSLRIEQHFYLPKRGQCKIVVGKGGSKIREIGIKACEDLRKLLNRKVHLFLEVKHGGGF